MIEWMVEREFFRNENHAIWFLCSIGFLVVLIVSHFLPNFSWIFLIVPLMVHVPPLVTSSYKIYKKHPSTIYSRDCIWFNALMIGIYVLLFVIIK